METFFLEFNEAQFHINPLVIIAILGGMTKLFTHLTKVFEP